MKKCSYCGKEYSDDATACGIDGQPLTHVAQRPNLQTELQSRHSPGTQPKHIKRTWSFGRAFGIALGVAFGGIWALRFAVDRNPLGNHTTAAVLLAMAVIGAFVIGGFRSVAEQSEVTDIHRRLDALKQAERPTDPKRPQPGKE